MNWHLNGLVAKLYNYIIRGLSIYIHIFSALKEICILRLMENVGIFCNNQLFYLNGILVIYNLSVVHTNGKNSLLAWFLSGLFDFYNGYPLKDYN